MKVVMVLMLTMSGVSSFANPQALEIYGREMARTHQEVTRLTPEVEQLRRDLASARERAAKVENDMKDLRGVSPANIQRLANDAQKSRERVIELEAKFNQQQANLDKAQRDYQGSVTGHQRVAGENAATAELRASLQNSQISGQISRNQISLLGADRTINELEKVLDRSDTGTYVKDKFGQFVNSDLICSGVNRCIRGTAPMPIAPEKLNEIFKDRTTPTRSEYYNQLRNKSAAGTQ